MPVLLAIETSQHAGSVALRDAAGNAHFEALAPKKRHDDDLLPAIDRMFKRAGLTPRDLISKGGGVAVSIGPGGFTGLRIAVSTAKMFAEALGAKVVAVPSALVAAESTPPLAPGSAGGYAGDRPAVPHRIIVALASKNETCWATRLERDANDCWRIVGRPGLVDAASLDLNEIEVLLGDQYLPDQVRRRCSEAGIQMIESVFDARACLSIGERMLRDGKTADPLALVPLYPRQPEAVSLWEKRQAKSAADDPSEARQIRS